MHKNYSYFSHKNYVQQILYKNKSKQMSSWMAKHTYSSYKHLVLDMLEIFYLYIFFYLFIYIYVYECLFIVLFIWFM